MSLERTAEIFDAILEDTLAGYWDWHILEDYEYLSPTFKRMFGYAEHELPNSPKTWQQLILEEDRSIPFDAFDKHVESQGKEPYEYRARYRHRDGHIVYMLCKGRIVEWAEDGSPVRMVGAHIDLRQLVETEQELAQSNQQLKLIVEGINAGVWDWNLETGKEWWSDRLFDLLGYSPGDLDDTQRTLLEELVLPEHFPMIEDAINAHVRDGVPFKQKVQFRTQSGHYRWFETFGKALINAEGYPIRMVGSIIDIHAQEEAALELERSQFMLTETAAMARSGGWELDLVNMEPRWSDTVRDIHEVPPDYKPDLEHAIDFFHPASQPVIREAVQRAIREQIPYDLELQFITAKGRQIWIRTVGKPVVNAQSKTIALRGIFQDIHESKMRERSLQHSLDIISNQNERLTNFAHIVSHNLRSHTGNLEMIMQLLDEEVDEQERAGYLANIRTISENLTETIHHLNEVITIQTEANQERSKLSFAPFVKRAVELIRPQLDQTGGAVTIDLDEAPEIYYVPAYLDSILLNLLSNAVKYRSPERPPQIALRTGKEGNRIVLFVTDNGLGLDLEAHGSKLFGMYKTFHRNKDARGIGLFITKNQVEALGGSIKVTSQPDKGTTFKITF